MCKTKSVSLNKQVSNNQKKYLNDCTKILVKEKKLPKQFLKRIKVRYKTN